MPLLDISTAFVALAFGYLVGAVPTAYMIARWVRGIDIRTHGSGNVGASNIGHHVGRRYGILVGILDALVKGVAPVLVVRAIGLELTYQALAGAGSIVGHNWSIYLKFSGGRGLSVILGALLVLAWKEFIALIIVGTAGLGDLSQHSFVDGYRPGPASPVGAVLPGACRDCSLYRCCACSSHPETDTLQSGQFELPGQRRRDKVLPRLLYDRDTMKAGGWVKRSPNQGENGE